MLSRVLVTLFVYSSLVCGAKPKQPPVTYSNVRSLPASCDAVWSRIVPVIAAKGFMPESSDRTGGFMRLRWTRGDSGGGLLGSDKEVKELTLHRKGFLETYDRFRIAGGALSLVADGEKCVATLQFEYQGFKGWGNLSQGWFALPSNNRFESLLLDDLEDASWKQDAAPPPSKAAVAVLPPPPLPPPPPRATPDPLVVVTLTSSPVGALVTFSGTEVARTPNVTKVPPGIYKVKMSLAGYSDWKLNLTVESGKPITINAELSPVAQ